MKRTMESASFCESVDMAPRTGQAIIFRQRAKPKAGNTTLVVRCQSNSTLSKERNLFIVELLKQHNEFLSGTLVDGKKRTYRK